MKNRLDSNPDGDPASGAGHITLEFNKGGGLGSFGLARFTLPLVARRPAAALMEMPINSEFTHSTLLETRQ
jgi:hypothetical protein